MDDGTKTRTTESEWSELWQQEIAAIRRTRRTTYIVAGVVAAIAVLIVLLPLLMR